MNPSDVPVILRRARGQRTQPAIRRLLLAAGLLLAGVAAAAAPAPQAEVTMQDGDATLLRGGDKLALAEGVTLEADDIVVVGPQARFLRIEFADGTSVALGPGTRALVAPHLGKERAHAAVYVLAGSAKLVLPPGTAGGLLSPALDVAGAGGSAVFELRAALAQVFAESGELQLTIHHPVPGALTLKSGEMASLADTGGKPAVSPRPTPAFVQAMPRAFMDTLPSRFAQWRDKAVAPKPIGPIAYADAQPWIDGEPELRKAYLKRWRPLARIPEFKRGLFEGIDAHPEWVPLLFQP